MNELTNITVEEVSFVDEGANPKAQLVLFKRREKTTGNPILATINRLSKKLEEHLNAAEEAQMRKDLMKYELLGEDSNELFQTLKAAKQKGLYDQIIKLLDKNLAAQSQLFEEIGKTGAYAANDPRTQIEKIAADYRQNDPTLGYRQSIDKAFVNNPNLVF